jgi:hypothetical protein
VATGRSSHAREVKGDHPDKNGFPGPPGWGLGVTPTPHIIVDVEKPEKCLRENGFTDDLAVKNRYDLAHGMSKHFKTGVLISLLSQLKQYRLDITGLQGTRLEGKDIMDVKSHTHTLLVVKKKEPESLGWHLW